MEKIRIEDLLRFHFPSNGQLSPTGRFAAFQGAVCDEKDNSYKTDIYLSDGGKAKRMTYSGNVSLLFWDDDETLILTKDEKQEEEAPPCTILYRMRVNGGEAEPWLTLPFPVMEMKRAGARYVITGGIDQNDPDAYLDDPETAKKKFEEKKKEADYEVLDEVPYWWNGQGFSNKKRTSLFILENGKPKRVTAPDFDVDSMILDGSRVLYTGSVRGAYLTLMSNLYAYDLESGETEALYDRLDISIGAVLPLGERLYVTATDMKAYGLNETQAFYEWTGKNALRFVEKPEVSLYDSTCGDVMYGGGQERVVEGDCFYTLSTVEDHNVLFSYDKDLDRRTLLDLGGPIGFMDVKGEKILTCRYDETSLPEIFLGTLEDPAGEEITFFNEEVLQDKFVSEPVLVPYESCGLSLHGWVLLPEEFKPVSEGGKKASVPAVLDVHGGPRCVYTSAFFHEMQVWASRGYAVFFTNIKGSDGRGDEFADIRGDYGNTDFRNLMDFTDEVLRLFPEIDPKRVCETGGSYGGFMTNWIITHTDRFAACASQRSISNWISKSFISDIGTFFNPDQCGAKGLFGEENTKALWDHSPLKYAENAKTPTLFIHSDQDYRCPLPEGMQMMQALAVRGVETRLVLFHGENHELSRSGKPLHRMRRLREITEWFDRHTEKE